jgi:glycosyltransferase involved in cell wall biosynthesis
MRLLVLHQNFPGQFGHLVRAWCQRPGWDVRALGRDTAPGLPGFNRLTRYKLARAPHAHQHPYLRTMESAVLHGQAVARVLLDMKKKGFTPDTVLAHPGWGESLYVKDVFPAARLVHFCEWYYQAEGADLGFDPEFPITFDDRARIRTWNALHTLNLTHCDAAVTPTHWQKSRHPEIFQPKIKVQHEGIDTEGLQPDPAATITTPSGTTLKAGDAVVTYVARNLEPYRGFHIFMRALEKLQLKHKTVHALIVGGDDVSYGQRPKGAKHWREKMLQEVKLDPTRTHFLGRIPRPQYIRVLQVSAAHVYLTYPFVLSWSLLEAMACGTSIVASDTTPVREAMSDGKTRDLVPFFDSNAIALAMSDAVSNREVNQAVRTRAMQAASTHSFVAGLRGYDRLVTWGAPIGKPRAMTTPLAAAHDLAALPEQMLAKPH